MEMDRSCPCLNREYVYVILIIHINESLQGTINIFIDREREGHVDSFPFFFFLIVLILLGSQTRLAQFSINVRVSKMLR